jgi:hypothetical protein
MKLWVILITLLVTVPLALSCKVQSHNQTPAPVQPPIPRQEEKQAEQAVRIYLKLSNDGFGDTKEREAVFKLEDELEQKISLASAGEYDGHDFGGGFGTLYMYGSNADKLFETIIESIRRYRPRAGSYIIKRYGEVGAREEKINL